MHTALTQVLATPIANLVPLITEYCRLESVAA